jgi:hypothetical protein
MECVRVVFDQCVCHFTEWREACVLLKCKSNVHPVHAMKAYRGSRGITPLIHDLSVRWMWLVNFMLWLLDSPWQEPQCALNRRLGGPQSWPGHFGEKKIPWLWWVSNVRLFCPYRSNVAGAWSWPLSCIPLLPLYDFMGCVGMAEPLRVVILTKKATASAVTKGCLC